MALQNGIDDEDWGNWDTTSAPIIEPTKVKRDNVNIGNTKNEERSNERFNHEEKSYRDNGTRDTVKKDFGERGGGFGDRGGGRDGGKKDFGDRDGGKKDFGDRDGGKKDFGDRDRGKKDFGDRDGGKRDSGDGIRRDYNNRGGRGQGDRDASRRDNNDRKPRDDSWDEGNKLSEKFQNNANVKDEGHSRTFYKRDGTDRDDTNNSEEPSVPKRVVYIPNDDEVDYDLHVNSGINFDNYEKIPVEVTGEDIPKPISKFSDLSIPDFLLKNIDAMKYIKLTPVQKYAIPIIAARRDLMACAQTGSGKTAAFLLPMIVALHNNRVETETSTARVAFPKALIMAPTRELCRQIFTAAKQLCQGSDLKCAYIYGGIEMNKSRKNLQDSGCDILVATPGRLIHFLELIWVSLKYLRYFVLDEGDRMMDKDGFYESISKISEEANFIRDDRTIQISMFSATFPNEIQNLAKSILSNYLFLAVGMIGSANSDVKQEIIRAEQKDKMNLAIEYVKSIPNEKTLIFVESKRMADFFGIKLGYLGFKATTIHGDREQEQRETALNDFKTGRVNFMVATNVAARGLDIPMVDTVINIDMPSDIDTYVHRIGRTGRCGNVGRAVSFFDDSSDIALAGPLVNRLQEANQECPEWLVALSDNTGSRKPTYFAKDNRRDMKVSKFVENNNGDFMKGSNADFDDD